MFGDVTLLQENVLRLFLVCPFVDSFVNSDWLNLVVSFLTNELVNQAVCAL